MNKLKEVGLYMENWILEVKEKTKGHPLYLVGYGNYGRILERYLNRNNIVINGIVDKNKEECLSFDYKFESDAFFIISSLVHNKSIAEELINNKVEENRIIANIQQEYIYAMLEKEAGMKQYLELNSQFRDIKKGKRCFVIGNGPSLRSEDLDKLKKEDTFGSNSIYKIYSQTTWRPTYYCGIDPVFCKVELGSLDKAKKLSSDVSWFFTSITNNGFDYREKIGNMRFIQTLNWSINGEKEPFFANDITNGICVSGTVTYLALQIAVFMGYKEIYLLGIDFSFSTERTRDGKIKVNDIKNHFDLAESAEVDRENKKVNGYAYIADVDIQKMEFQKAKEYADSHGIKIYNATRGGKLEVFDRVDFDSLF